MKCSFDGCTRDADYSLCKNCLDRILVEDSEEVRILQEELHENRKYVAGLRTKMYELRSFYYKEPLSKATVEKMYEIIIEVLKE